jgi:hypothetical protein
MKTYLLSAVVAGLFATSSAMAQDDFAAMGAATGSQMTEGKMANVEGGFRIKVNLNANLLKQSNTATISYNAVSGNGAIVNYQTNVASQTAGGRYYNF